MLSSFKDFGVVTYLYNPDFSLHQFNFSYGIIMGCENRECGENVNIFLALFVSAE